MSHLTTLRTSTESSQTPQSNGKKGSSTNKSGGPGPSRLVPISQASVKSRTTSENGVAVASARSGNPNSKFKKPTQKRQVVEVSDSDDDDSLERGAALASPAKGAEFRKTSTVSKIFVYLSLYIIVYYD